MATTATILSITRRYAPAAGGPPAGPVRVPSLIAAAARAAEVGSRNGVVYRSLPSRGILNRCDSETMPFEWTINPYRGCEFACRYCYARYTHEYMGIEDARRFETEIFAKEGAAAALDRELPPGRRLAGSIAIGTATDPYQPAERRLGVTRGILGVLARRDGLRLSVTTKSDLVVRDIDLLREIAARNRLVVNVTITTLNRRLARMLEPRAPRPARRLEAVQALARAGIETGVYIMPVLPGITDSRPTLESIVAAASRAGALYVGQQVLFLRSSAKRVFYPFLSERFPRLSPRYHRIYGASATHTAEYRGAISATMKVLRRCYGLAPGPGWMGEEGAGQAQGPAHGGGQMPLTF